MVFARGSSRILIGLLVSLSFVVGPSTLCFGAPETVPLPAGQIVNTPKEVTEALSLIEQAAIVKTGSEKRVLLGVTMQLESLMTDTLASTGKSMRIYPETIFKAIEDQVAAGVKDKKKIADSLVLAYRLGKLTGKGGQSSILIEMEDGKVVNVKEGK